MKNVSTIHNCYGCGVCAVSCGKKIINIRLNEDGFYAPYIDEPENVWNVVSVLMCALSIIRSER